MKALATQVNRSNQNERLERCAADVTQSGTGGRAEDEAREAPMRNVATGLSRWGLFWHRLHTRKALLDLTRRSSGISG